MPYFVFITKELITASDPLGHCLLLVMFRGLKHHGYMQFSLREKEATKLRRMRLAGSRKAGESPIIKEEDTDNPLSETCKKP